MKDTLATILTLFIMLTPLSIWFFSTLPDESIPEGYTSSFFGIDPDKPTLAVFCMKWCGPCQSIKKSLLPLESFKNLFNEYNLVNITDKEDLNEKYGVKKFPSFLIFNKNMQREPAILSCD